MKTISRYIMTLALLLTAVTGAWADGDTKYNVTFKANGNTKVVENVTLPKTFSCNWDDDTELGTDELDLIIQELYGLSAGCCKSFAPNSDNASVTCALNGGNQSITISGPFNGTATVTGRYEDSNHKGIDYTLEITCVDPNAEPAEPAIDFEWNPATKTGTFTMPAFDVEIAPIYAPTAMFATDGNLVLTPTAIEGIYAESTDAIVKAGTVAKIGETENAQGIVMYAVTSTNQATAPALTAFSADVPTAKDIKVGSDVLVWYYIKGADTPEGEEATAENTFNDSEICETPITVTVIPINYDIQFKAANDNTIQAGKATVKVGETAARVDNDGNLTSVKMNSKVTVTAKEGYKFRKVEATHQGWQRKGLGTITDGFFTSLFYKPDITVHCNVYENVNTPGLYKIDGFQCALVAAYFGISEEEMKRYEGENWKNVKILIDATNPEKVSISAQQYGVLVNPDYGFIRIRSEATGKLVDNAITFPSQAMHVGFEGLGRWYYGNGNGTFKIMLPK